MRTQADKIVIKDLAVFYAVGVPDEERAEPQKLLLTVEMTYDFTDAAGTDDLKLTIDYHAVALRLLRFGEGQSWRLIETLAVNIAEMVLEEFKPQSVFVRVKKFILPDARHVEVSVTRP